MSDPGILETAAARARRVADEVLFPRAQETDTATLVPRDNLDALRDAGLNGLQGPADAGGLGADHAGARSAFEAISGACGATAFVWAQHHGAVRRLTGGDGPARDGWLPALCGGSALAGIGFAYLRRPGPAAVRATWVAGGWRLDGEAPWITGWGLADVFVIMARSRDDAVVTAVVDRPYERVELHPGPPQRLAVMGSTGTVSLTFDGAVVDEGNVAGVQTRGAWAFRDRIGASMPPAAPLGIAGRAARLLAERSERSQEAAEASAGFEGELRERRAAADEIARSLLAQTSHASEELDGLIEEGSIERERGLDLARRSTDALVASSGGGAMDLAHPAQRLSREATFYLIQAQTGTLRTATIARTLLPAHRGS